MNKKEKFLNFLESFKGKGQDTLIESIKKGFQTCFEALSEKDMLEMMQGMEHHKMVTFNPEDIDKSPFMIRHNGSNDFFSSDFGGDTKWVSGQDNTEIAKFKTMESAVRRAARISKKDGYYLSIESSVPQGENLTENVKQGFKACHENFADPSGISGSSANQLKAQMKQHLKNKFSGLAEVETNDFNFDMEAAIYWFANGYHGGQFTDLYSILSTSDYSPGRMTSGVEEEGEMAKMLYDELVAKFPQ